ncbi:HNH endonuclease [Rosenbergiella nectarea]|uniref:HNH endonuclease n=1 Tax=Rosenbergiella nectarea TaxID=988801 RepID=UPI001F4E3288|nr:HNH endonuclease [Rosenbergiella nectarea]
MKKNFCFLCEEEITEKNDSKEHIIPNAIGGKRKVKGFICNICNNTSGDTWESALANQLNPLSLFFGIIRERGNTPPQFFETTGGEKYKLNHDGHMDIEKPIYSLTNSEYKDALKISIKARSKSEAKKMLIGIKRKYPKSAIDVNELLDNAKLESSYCPDWLKFNLSFGGQDSGRSIVKSASALAVSSGILPKYCIEAKNYLKNKDAEACFGYFYESDLVKNRPIGIPFHCVSIKGCSTTKQVIAYLEYFGVQRVVMCLSSSYDGDDIEGTYAINPINGEELNLVIELNLSNDDIREAYNYKKIPKGSIESAFDKVIPTGLNSAFEKEQDRIINRAVKRAFKNCGAKEGEILNSKHISIITDIIIEELKPFIIHNMVNSRKKESL